MGSQFDEWDDEDDDEEEGQGNGPAGLRKALKDAQRELKQARSQIAEFGKTTRKRTVSDVLAAKGLNPKLAALLPSDVESTDEAITAWVEEFSELFAPAVGQAQSAEVSADTVEGSAIGQSFFTEAELEAHGVINRADGAQSAPTGSQSLEARLKGATSMEELVRIARAG